MKKVGQIFFRTSNFVPLHIVKTKLFLVYEYLSALIVSLLAHIGYFYETLALVTEETLVHRRGGGAPGLEEAESIREALAADHGQGCCVRGNQHRRDPDEVLSGHGHDRVGDVNLSAQMRISMCHYPESPGDRCTNVHVAAKNYTSVHPFFRYKVC